MGNLITLAAGFMLASKGVVHISLFLGAFLGLALIMASACVFNNYIDRFRDKKMERTKKRALVTGVISEKKALLFGTLLALIGTIVLYAFTNLLTLFVAGFGFFMYVILYSLWKSRTIYGTAIGSIAGAVPPVVGYTAVSNQFDLGAAILFGMMVLWQMPHFFAIAIYRLDDYIAAAIPVLPAKKGMLRTKIHMTIYVAAFMVVAALLTLFHYAGYIYLVSAIGLGLLWFALCLKGFKTNDDTLWGKQMFRLSLVLITSICLVIPFDTVHV